MPEEHAKLSPSALAATALCPGRPNAIAALPPGERDVPSQASIDGTRRHALLEWRCHNPHNPWPTQVRKHLITSEDVRVVTPVWAYLESHPSRNIGQGNRFASETWVEIGKWCGLENGVLWGTIDNPMIYPGTLEIADAKFGHRIVSPHDNLQLKAYAIGYAAELFDRETGEFKPQYRQTKLVKLTIMQPTVAQVITSAVAPFEQLVTWAAEIKKIGLAALDPAAPRVPGDVQCKWCPAAGTCPERLASVASAARAMFEILGPEGQQPGMESQGGHEFPSPIASVDAITKLAEVRMTQDPTGMTPEQVARVLDQAQLIEGWLADVRKVATKLASTGDGLPGWKLIAGRRSRAWTGTDADVVDGLKMCGLTKGQMFKQSLISPNEAEKIERISGSQKARERFLQMWVWKEGKPVLAPASDPAPAIRDAKTMFSPVADPPEPEPFTPEWI